MKKKKLTPEAIFDKLDELHQEEQDLLEQLRDEVCKCDDMDPHEELYLHSKEPETPIYEDVDGKAIKCGTHNRYKKSCPICKEIAGVV